MRAARWLLGGAGLAAMAYAGYLLLTDEGVRLAGVLPFLVAVAVAHDLILMPLAIAVGVLVVRIVPAGSRGYVQGGLFASAVVSVFALPFVIGTGKAPDNPSKLPLDYGRGLVIVLAAIWLGVAVRLLWARLSAKDDG